MKIGMSARLSLDYRIIDTLFQNKTKQKTSTPYKTIQGIRMDGYIHIGEYSGRVKVMLRSNKQS